MKKTLALLLAVMMVMTLAACGAPNEAPAAPAAEAPAAQAPDAPAAEAPAAPASGEPSGEQAPPPSGEKKENTAHGGAAGAITEEDYKAYLKDWLEAENAVNDSMTDEQAGEFFAMIDAGAYTELPAETLFSGKLDTGAAMTYDEFVAANGVY